MQNLCFFFPAGWWDWEGKKEGKERDEGRGQLLNIFSNLGTILKKIGVWNLPYHSLGGGEPIGPHYFRRPVVQKVLKLNDFRKIRYSMVIVAASNFLQVFHRKTLFCTSKLWLFRPTLEFGGLNTTVVMYCTVLTQNLHSKRVTSLNEMFCPKLWVVGGGGSSSEQSQYYCSTNAAIYLSIVGLTDSWPLFNWPKDVAFWIKIL